MVADDHPTFREGLSRYLKDEEDIEVVATSADGEETVRLAKQLMPDVIIMDIAMPKLDGIEAAKQIKQACPNTAILMISGFNYESYILASLQAGAAGYLLKSASIREVIYAARMVYSGEAVFNLAAASGILRRLSAGRDQEWGGLGTLNKRELEVLKAAAKGTSNKDIANKLSISERTVQTHLFNIFRKLGVGSRTEAVLHALKTGWLTLDDLP